MPAAAMSSAVHSIDDGADMAGTESSSHATSNRHNDGGSHVEVQSSCFVPIKIVARSRKDRKTNPIWNYFAAVHPSVTDYKANSYVCCCVGNVRLIQ
jgi:hypothetical protein